MMRRREFIGKSAIALGGAVLSRRLSALDQPTPAANVDSRISFETTDHQYQSVYSHALDALHGNVTTVESYPHPVLIEGSIYGGIWLECAPQEGLVYAPIRPDVARNNHLGLLAMQREDGQIPCWLRLKAVGFAQIQMVVPIAATAWELSQSTGDSELLEKAYDSCSRWDQWLRKYRDTRHTGLCEGFCTYDTGHDNSPRWAGIPNRCENGDARKCPPIASLPRLSPDLSATVYGGRVSLAEMARALGQNTEADRWHADAESIRKLIIEKLYLDEDAAFYDLDAQNHFVRIRGDVISRVLGEHVVDQKMFETIYSRQIHNPSAFWAPYPLTSIAMDDPAFVRPIPVNSWGGASQALTALRAPRWMEHYGKPADLGYLMQKWIEAMLRTDKFLQQIDPMSGKYTSDEGNYSPAALAFLDFTWRLSGVRQEGTELVWNIAPMPKMVSAKFRLRVSSTRVAELTYASGAAQLKVNDKEFCNTSNNVRLVTDETGKVKRAVGISAAPTAVTINQVSGPPRKFTINANEVVNLT